LPPAERDGVLREFCRADPELRARLENLIALADSASGFIQRSSVRTEADAADPAPDQATDPLVRPFRIVRPLGAGGTISTATDVYALGVTLFQLLAGRLDLTRFSGQFLA
jgi:serine/threonine protein kinase